MAAEPYIDITDPAYWQELADIDLRDARHMAQRGRRYLAGLKCCKAAENSLCGYFVRSNFANSLPQITNLAGFAVCLGLWAQLPGRQRQLLDELQEFKDATASPSQKQALELAYDDATTAALIERTAACTQRIWEVGAAKDPCTDISQ